MNIKKMQELMLQKGLSQRDLAKKVGIHEGHISRIIHQKTTNLQINTIQGIADALGVHISLLL